MGKADRTGFEGGWEGRWGREGSARDTRRRGRTCRGANGEQEWAKHRRGRRGALVKTDDEEEEGGKAGGRRQQGTRQMERGEEEAKKAPRHPHRTETSSA